MHTGMGWFIIRWMLVFNFYLFLLATAVAVLEIQVEGKNGWAEKLPAWRPARGSKLRRFYATFSNRKELDGYHVALLVVLILVFFLPFAFGVPLNLAEVVKALSLFFMFMVVWDFLWFVWNPWFTVRKFSRRHIPWHKSWFLGLPFDYWEGILVSLIFILGIPSLIVWWSFHILAFLFWIAISNILSLIVIRKPSA